MIVDRFTKAILTVIAAALVMIAARPFVPAVLERLAPARVEAQPSGAAKYEVSLPRSWGKYVSYSNNNLLLEDANHDLRIVDVEGKAPEYPKVKVLIHWQ